MTKTNFHTHNYRCGHAVGSVEDYVKEAIKHNYTELGISDHSPLPDYCFDRMGMDELDGYFEEIEMAQKKYKGKIKIYKSLEAEYFPEFNEFYEKLKTKLDYLLLGLHLYPKNGKINDAWAIKDDEGVIDYAYFMKDAIESNYFEIVAHPDVFMAGYRNWTEACIEATHIICRAAEKMDIVLEINANGIRKTEEKNIKGDRYLYPYKEFWEIVAEYNIRTIIGSDCHDYKMIEDKATQKVREFARELNISPIETIFR